MSDKTKAPTTEEILQNVEGGIQDVISRANVADQLNISPQAQLNHTMTDRRISRALLDENLDIIERRLQALAVHKDQIEREKRALATKEAICQLAIKSMEAARETLMEEK